MPGKSRAKPKQPKRRADRHLRLTVEVSDQGAHVLDARVVGEPAIAAPSITGPFVYRVQGGGRTLHVDTLPDPLAERGYGRPDRPAHSFRRASSALIPVRIPLVATAIPRDLAVHFFVAAKPVNDWRDLIGRLAEARPAGFTPLAKIDLASLHAVKSWRDVVAAHGLREEPPPRPTHPRPKRPRLKGRD